MRAHTLAAPLLALALGCGGPSRASNARDTSGGEAATNDSVAAEDARADAARDAHATEDTDTTRRATEDESSAPARDASASTTETPGDEAGAGEAALASTPAHPADGSIRANIEILERQSRELEQVASAVVAIRPLVAVDASGIPPVCADRRPIEGLRMIGTSGSAGATAALGALEAIEDYCTPFDRWTNPTDREAQRVRGYLQQVDRIIGWMHDIERCSGTTGAERARCENAYSDVQREAAEEAARALVLLDAHLRELGPVRTAAARFPCTTPTLEQIAAVTWVGAVARAQLGGLSRAADEVCRTIGVDARSQREAHRRVSMSLDRAESNARAQRRSLLETIESLRPYAP